MYQIDDVIKIINGTEELRVMIVKINLDGTFEVETAQGIILRIYREDVIEE